MNTVNSSEQIRHRFTTVWLILGIVYFSLVGFFRIIGPNDDSSLSSSMRMFQMLANLAQAVSIYFILKWIKYGFWGFLGASVLSIMLQIIGNNVTMNKLEGELPEEVLSMMNIASSVGLILGIIGVISIWGVLQIRKDGKSAWSQLV